MNVLLSLWQYIHLNYENTEVNSQVKANNNVTEISRDLAKITYDIDFIFASGSAS